MGLSSDLIDLDGVIPDRDLQVAREALEAARREGQEFAPSFDAVVSFFAEREVTDYTPRLERDHLVAALSTHEAELVAAAFARTENGRVNGSPVMLGAANDEDDV